MPSNGEINVEAGAYRTLCCDAEIVLQESAVFPDCPNHPNLPTIWKPIRSADPASRGRDQAA